MSLIELLVSLAVSAIVLSAAMILIMQGMKSYQRQTLTAQLQEDAGIAMNQISDQIMEATLLNINENTSGKRNTTAFSLNSLFMYDYNEASQDLIIKSTGGSGSESLLCNHVSAFKVQIVKSSVNTEMGLHGAYIKSINNPVQIKVTIEVSDSGVTRRLVRVTAMRNTINDLTLATSNIKVFPDSEVLSKYEFLTD